MNIILKPNNIDINLLSIKKKINISSDITNYPIKYGKNNLVIQSPIVYLPFGINRYNNKGYIDISFINSNDIVMNKFKETLLDVEKYLIRKFNKNKKFITSFKVSEYYPDRLRLSFYDDILVFNEAKSLISLDYIKSKIYVKLLISPQFLWTTNDKYGIVWNMLQVKIYSKPMLETYSFIDDDEVNIDKYIKMFRCGVPGEAVKNKMAQDKIDPLLLNKYLPKSEIELPILKPFIKLENKKPIEKKDSNTSDTSGFRMTLDQLKNIKLKKISNRIPPPFTHMNPFVNPDILNQMRNKIIKL
jgi:hypothetical protein